MEISLVMAEARPAFSAACRAMQEANLVLLLMEVTNVIVGTNLILVPSGKLVDVEQYHLESLSFTSYMRSAEHSTCKALTFSFSSPRSFFLSFPDVDRIGFHIHLYSLQLR